MNRSAGFTLMEMIVSLTILSIITLGLMNFGVSSSTLYIEANHRLQALEEARFVMARFQRELINAVPFSTRTLNNGRCVEFIPILGVTEYDPDAFELNADNLSTGVQLRYPLSQEIRTTCASQTCRASIHPTNTNALYGNADAQTQIYNINPSLIGTDSLVLTDAILSRPVSLTNRMYVYSPNAVQLCLQADEVRYYPSYPLTAQGLGLSNPEPSLTFASGVVERDNIFDIGVDANYSNIASIHFELRINNGSETVEFMQNAQILNTQ
ncbi:prepilin-type N-terminal cleavage/methylation domain-containing protein [Vibrio aquaticus]|uniref:Prepilin-type N-terminal cleavage/methylation domain-containing protein n=1 Tax=Vibrio aquaticus TaxID=2496559 RepID=A0A432CXC7_9VIBR|nr:prepilin-type N-terminal cleavage/methylation domain-containing protein [Vibrio aquaticus]RTZ16512.1 prepilin-type N-terminal cleavage/methylation domain-containing protein [Vibrio aquaticus]